METRGVHRSLPNIYSGAFCEISWVFLLKRPITYIWQGSKYAPGKFVKGESLTSRNFHIHIFSFSYSWNYHKLNFKTHIINICTVANQKLRALCRISNYTDSDKCKLLSVNAFVKSQFSYCPLIWMFYTQESHYRLNRVLERALGIILGLYFEFQWFCNTVEWKNYSSNVDKPFIDWSLQISKRTITRLNEWSF